MKLTRSTATALCVSALALGIPLSAAAATTHPATPAASSATASTSLAVYDCGNKPLVKPGTFVFTCDSSGYLAGLRWSSWQNPTAAGTGVLYTDNCKPNCASGTWSHQNVDVVLWRSEGVKGQPGRRGYTEMTILWPNHALRSHNTETVVPPGAFPGEI